MPEKPRDQLVQRETVFHLLIRAQPNVHTTTLAKFHPTTSREFAIRSADSVGMNRVSPRQVARARQPFAGLQVVADDAERDLRDQLLANRNFTVFGEPQSHRGLMALLVRGRIS